MFYVQCIETHYINNIPFVKGELFTFTEVKRIGLDLPCDLPKCLTLWAVQPKATIGKFALVSGFPYGVELKKTIDCGEFYGIERNLHRVGKYSRRLKREISLRYIENHWWVMS